jgi:hypothetical protein
LNLPYGFGFDDFIKRLKEENLNSEDEKFIDILKKILIKLNLADEGELLQLYRETVSNNNKLGFKEKARNIILQKIILEV